jgi:hypothetical protein
MTPQPTLTTRTIGETENALRAILNRNLVGTGLDYHSWVALKVASESSSVLSPADLSTFLQGGLKIDEAAAADAINDLLARELLAGGDVAVEATPQGTVLYQRLNDRFGQLTRQMYAGLETDDLAAAYRVLSTLTERANALLAS